MNFQVRRNQILCLTNLLIFSRCGRWSGTISNISDGAGPTGSVPGKGPAPGQHSSWQGGVRGPARGRAGRRLSLGSLGVLPPALTAPALQALGAGSAQVHARFWVGVQPPPIIPPSLCPAFLALARSPKFLPCWRQDVLSAKVHSSGIHSHLACPGLSPGPRGLAQDPAAHQADGSEAVTQEREAPGLQTVNPQTQEASWPPLPLNIK